MNNFEIKSASPSNVAAIFSLIKEIAEYEKLSNQVIITEKLLATALFEDKTCECVVGQEDGVTIGYALFFHNFSTFIGRKGLYLEDLYVKADKRGLGYGKKLFQYLIDLAKQRNCGRMEWSCLNWNEPSIKFYQSMGAEAMSDWTVYRLTF